MDYLRRSRRKFPVLTGPRPKFMRDASLKTGPEQIIKDKKKNGKRYFSLMLISGIIGA